MDHGPYGSNPNESSCVQVEEVKEGVAPPASAAMDKKPVKTLGACPLFPNVRGILGILKKKKPKPNKHLDSARQEPSSTTVVDDRTVLPLHGAGEEDSRGDDFAGQVRNTPTAVLNHNSTCTC